MDDVFTSTTAGNSGVALQMHLYCILLLTAESNVHLILTHK